MLKGEIRFLTNSDTPYKRVFSRDTRRNDEMNDLLWPRRRGAAKWRSIGIDLEWALVDTTSSAVYHSLNDWNFIFSSKARSEVRANRLVNKYNNRETTYIYYIHISLRGITVHYRVLTIAFLFRELMGQSSSSSRRKQVFFLFCVSCITFFFS